MSCPSIDNNKIKPKSSIPLKKISIINEIEEDDKKKYKKLKKEFDLAFKVSYQINNIILQIVFNKQFLVKGIYNP